MAAIGEFQNNESKRYSENHQDEQLGWGVKPFEMHLRRLKNAIIDMKKEISWESVQTTPYETETGEKFYKIHLYDIPGKAESMKDFLDEGLLYVEEDLTGKKSGAVRNIGRWNRILVLGRNKNEEVLELKKLPQTNIISTSPNIHSERLQTSAINSLKDNQLSSHKPIVKLFYEYDDNTWPTVNIQSVNKWYVLTDKNRKGVDQQRKFVEIALNTPDFAFLEGPPGSGKTTILCELIAQLVSQNKKILVCASTHVAVDNVLERIIKYNSILKEEKIMPIRYGNLKEMPHVVKKWESTNFCNTKKQEFINYLSEIKPKTESQKTFLDLLKQKNNDFDEILQNCANIVCGTTIGINKFLKKNMEFDVMIIDEASKTTFTEFLVPALYAKRWIIVGDIHQLPPYLDERGEVANVIEMAVSSKYKKNAAIDVFNAVNDGQISVIITNDRAVKNTYKNQCGVHDVKYVDLDEFTSDYDHFTIFKELHDAKIIIGSSQSIEKNLSHIPCDATIIRNVDERFGMLERRASSWRKRNKIELKTWGAEISWRMKMIHEENLIQDSRYHRSDSIYQKNMEQLLPVDDIEDVKKNLQYTKMTVLPSFLEFIQQGFQKNKGHFKTVMSDGMPTKAINERHVSLTWQHRMHDEIANFPHVHIYNKKSLHTPDIIKNERIWITNFPLLRYFLNLVIFHKIFWNLFSNYFLSYVVILAKNN